MCMSVPKCSLYSIMENPWGEESNFVRILLLVPLQIINPNSNLLRMEEGRKRGKDRGRG